MLARKRVAALFRSCVSILGDFRGRFRTVALAALAGCAAKPSTEPVFRVAWVDVPITVPLGICVSSTVANSVSELMAGSHFDITSSARSRMASRQVAIENHQWLPNTGCHRLIQLTAGSRLSIRGAGARPDTDELSVLSPSAPMRLCLRLAGCPVGREQRAKAGNDVRADVQFTSLLLGHWISRVVITTTGISRKFTQPRMASSTWSPVRLGGKSRMTRAGVVRFSVGVTILAKEVVHCLLPITHYGEFAIHPGALERDEGEFQIKRLVLHQQNRTTHRVDTNFQ